MSYPNRTTFRDWVLWHEADIFIILCTAFWIILACVLVAHARPGPQWANEPKEIRQWFQGLMQPDAPTVSCCGEADAFEADQFTEDSDGQYVAIITDGKGIIPDGTKIHVPNAKIKWDKGNPTGHGIIFIGSGMQLYCYVPPGGV